MYSFISFPTATTQATTALTTATLSLNCQRAHKVVLFAFEEYMVLILIKSAYTDPLSMVDVNFSELVRFSADEFGTDRDGG